LPLEAVPLPTVPPMKPPRASLAELWSKPRLVWMVVLTAGGAATVDYAVILWGPTIISLLLKTTITEATRFFVLVVLCGVVGKVFFSILPHYVGRRRAGQLHGFGLAAGIALAGYFHSVFIGSFPLFVLLLMGTNVFMQGGLTNLAPYNIEVFGVRLGARAAGLNQASNGVGKVFGPLLLALSAGSGRALTPRATEQAILPAFTVLSICALAIGLAITFLGPETHGKLLTLEEEEEGKPVPAASALPGV
jgi:putative MFS transporter